MKTFEEVFAEIENKHGFWWDFQCFVGRNTRKIKDFFTSFIRFFRNSWKFRKILANDEDFDHRFLFDIIKFKLENMEKFFDSEYTWSADAKIYAQEIRDTLAYLNSTEDYDDNFYNDEDGFLEMNGTPYEEYINIDNEAWNNFFDNLKKYSRNWWD